MFPLVHRSAQPHGIILAGGAGRRIGGNKPAVLLAGRSLLDHVIARLAPQLACLAISTNAPSAQAYPTLPDAEPDLGPLSGILAGLRWAAADGAAWLLTTPCDTPFLPADLAARLTQAAAETAAPFLCAADAEGRAQPTLCLLRTTLADDLSATLAQGTRAIRHWRSPTLVPFDDADAFFNINTLADLAQAKEKLAAGGRITP